MTDVLFGGSVDGSDEKLRNIIGAVKKIRLSFQYAVKLKAVDVKLMKSLNEKLEKCRNQDNNPDSQT